jgi:hypothetical protein
MASNQEDGRLPRRSVARGSSVLGDMPEHSRPRWTRPGSRSKFPTLGPSSPGLPVGKYSWSWRYIHPLEVTCPNEGVKFALGV